MSRWERERERVFDSQHTLLNSSVVLSFCHQAWEVHEGRELGLAPKQTAIRLADCIVLVNLDKACIASLV
jgi:hypothetical protein